MTRRRLDFPILERNSFVTFVFVASLAFALLASHRNISMTRRTNLWTYFYGQYGDLADDAN